MRLPPPIACLLAAVLAASPAIAAAQASNPAARNSAEPKPLSRADFLAQMDAQFAKIDSDANGQLSRAEIEQLEKQKALAEAQARNDALFDRLDANKNGQISAKEFAKLIPDPPPANATPMLSREDSNRDGQISLVEHRSATLANFDRLDADKDGVVSAAEMKAGGISPR